MSKITLPDGAIIECKNGFTRRGPNSEGKFKEIMECLYDTVEMVASLEQEVDALKLKLKSREDVIIKQNATRGESVLASVLHEINNQEENFINSRPFADRFIDCSVTFRNTRQGRQISPVEINPRFNIVENEYQYQYVDGDRVTTFRLSSSGANKLLRTLGTPEEEVKSPPHINVINGPGWVIKNQKSADRVNDYISKIINRTERAERKVNELQIEQDRLNNVVLDLEKNSTNRLSFFELPFPSLVPTTKFYNNFNGYNGVVRSNDDLKTVMKECYKLGYEKYCLDLKHHVKAKAFITAINAAKNTYEGK